MAKKQKRRSVSVTRELYVALQIRADQLNVSISRYVHELVAADLRSVGIEPPLHVHDVRPPLSSPTLVPIVAPPPLKPVRDETRNTSLASSTPLAQMRARGVVTPWKPAKVDKLSADAPKPAAGSVCAYCECSWSESASRSGEDLARVETDAGPMHAKCARVRERLARRAAAQTEVA